MSNHADNLGSLDAGEPLMPAFEVAGYGQFMPGGWPMTDLAGLARSWIGGGCLGPFINVLFTRPAPRPRLVLAGADALGRLDQVHRRNGKARHGPGLHDWAGGTLGV